jgi:type VI protein secretion system component VasF
LDFILLCFALGYRGAVVLKGARLLAVKRNKLQQNAFISGQIRIENYGLTRI